MEQKQRTIHSVSGVDAKVWLANLCRKNGLNLSEEQVHNLSTYTHRLLEWNAKVNLISRKDTDNVWQAHILHSLAIPLMVDLPKGARVLDLGSGGGLPGAVLKIVRPDLTMVCLDATRKKMDAVHDILTAMGLEGVRAAWGRAEDLARVPEYSRSFDIVVARAVASLRDLVRWSLPFLQNKGATSADTTQGTRRVRPPALVTLKGGDLTQEIHQARVLRPDARIRESLLSFHGSEQIPGTEKKIVIVEF